MDELARQPLKHPFNTGAEPANGQNHRQLKTNYNNHGSALLANGTDDQADGQVEQGHSGLKTT
nr:hypothetical protein [uncultured Cohaesibacter sp.]